MDYNNLVVRSTQVSIVTSLFPQMSIANFQNAIFTFAYVKDVTASNYSSSVMFLFTSLIRNLMSRKKLLSINMLLQYT